MLHDLRSSLRRLLRRPFHSLASVLILALGLSSAVAVFTYINGFDQSFPGVDTGGLVRIFGIEDEDSYQNISYLDFQDYATAGQSVFEGLAATQPFYAASVRRETMTEVAFLEAVSGNYFSVLGAGISLGRGLTAEDDRPGADPAAVISQDWFQRSFNADPSVIGSTLYLNFRPFTVVGVASPDFLGTVSSYRPDVWIPFAPFKDRYVNWRMLSEDRDVPLVRVYGRLRAGTEPVRAKSELQAMAAGLDEAYPRKSGRRQPWVGAATWIDPRVRLAEQPTVRLLMAAAGLLLLLVCANVANLLLSVALGRSHEVSVRAALGASPLRLARQTLMENLLLAAAAGTAALLLAGPVTARLGSYFARPSIWGENVARQVTVDLHVTVFAVAVSVLVGVMAGLLPAWRVSRYDLIEALKGSSARSTAPPLRLAGRRIPGALDGLVTIQAALSIVLLVVAGLVLRTLGAVSSLDPGFAYDHLLVTHISTSSTDLKPPQRDRFFRQLAEQVAREPWVRSATVADYPPLSPHPSAEMRLEGRDDPLSLLYSKVLPGFFGALGIEVVEGRTFGETDRQGARDVAMVNRSLVRRFFPADNPVGKRIWWPQADGTERTFEIVGVVRDTKTQDFILDPEPTVYFSYPQHSYPTGSALILSTYGDPGSAAPLLYRRLRQIEPHLAIVNVVPYTEVVRGFLYSQRMNAELFSVLAFLGLGLAAAGIFSVGSISVRRRTKEFGIRISIGAQRSEIGRLAAARMLKPLLFGLGLGLTASLGLTGLVQGLLYGVQPIDPLTLALGTLALLTAGLVAAYLPTRRAVRVDPIVALREE